MPKAALILKGRLQVWDKPYREGGYAAPAVTIGKRDLTCAIEEFARRLPRAAGQREATQFREIGELLGLWTITIERIE